MNPAMKVICLNGGTPPRLIESVRPRPVPGRDEVLVRVCAAGVMLTELSWYPTTHTRGGGSRQGGVPGHDFSGAVVAVGEGADASWIGREVFGMNDWYADGAMAEYCTAPLQAVAPKPRSLTHAQAAAVPISALTAWQGLFDHAKLEPGERVLVHGGAGAVGVFAIQLARLHGARVFATASREDLALVSSLGAEQVIDYQRSRFEDFVPEVDVVFDTVGGETQSRSWNVLGANGRLITVVSTAEQSTDPRVKAAFFIVVPDQKQLTEIAALLDTERLRPVLSAVVPLSEAPDFYSGRIKKTGPGKIVATVSCDTAAGSAS